MGMALQPEFEDQQLVQLAGVIPRATLVALQQAAHRVHADKVVQPCVRGFERVVEELPELPVATHPQTDRQSKALFLLAADLFRQDRHHRLFEERTFLRSVQFVMSW